MPATNYVFNMAMSLDGFIADAEGGVGWLDGYMSEEFRFDDFVASVDTLVMGRVTYEQVGGFLGKGIPLLGRAEWRSNLRLLEARYVSNGAATLSYQLV
jgi:dihydrofolate reductase